MAKLFANSGDPNQTPRSAMSDLGLHCLSSTLLWVSRLKWVKEPFKIVGGNILFFLFEKISLTFQVIFQALFSQKNI